MAVGRIGHSPFMNSDRVRSERLLPGDGPPPSRGEKSTGGT